MNAERIVTIARQIVAGEVGLIEGAREIVQLARDAPDGDGDFLYFIAVESQTDHLPVGSVRAEWALEALREKDVAIREFEAAEHNEAVRHCERLIRRFSQEPKNASRD